MEGDNLGLIWHSDMTKAGWVVAFDMEFVEITADPKASLNLLKVVCAVVNQ